MARSKGEEHIARLLHEAGIPFETEKIIDARGFKGYKLPYDFYGIRDGNEFLIEFQGAEHYEYIPYFHKKLADFKRRQVYDERKIGAAIAMGVPLYCIPYWDLESLQCADDLFKDKYLARSQNHNYEAFRAHNSNL